MKILFASHLKIRLKERRIPAQYPRIILNQSEMTFADPLTGHFVAIKTLEYNKKLRPMVVVYDIIESEIQVVTIYPTTNQEIKNRVKSKRWLPILPKGFTNEKS